MTTISKQRLREHADTEARLLHVIAEHDLRPTHTYGVVKDENRSHRLADVFQQSVVVIKKAPIPNHTRFPKGGVNIGYQKDKASLYRSLSRNRAHFRRKIRDSHGPKSARYQLRYRMTGDFMRALEDYQDDINATGAQNGETATT